MNLNIDWNISAVSGGSKGGGEAASLGPKFLHFHAVFGKNWPNNRLVPPPLGLAPLPLGNPRSVTGCGTYGVFTLTVRFLVSESYFLSDFMGSK